jgi:predicted dehydrogenase
MHAVQALEVMKRGKHVYCEKPLTHDIYEARVLTEVAEKYKVVTQMGNQGSSGDDTRYVESWIQDGTNMNITNFEPANQFVRRKYRGEWNLDHDFHD